MSGPDDDFLEMLRSTFNVEAAEHLQAISAGLLELERAAGDEVGQALEKIFRAAHTLKGAARAVGVPEIERACQSLEEEFAAAKRRGVEPSPEALDEMHRAVDSMTSFLSLPSMAAVEPPVIAQTEMTPSVNRSVEPDAGTLTEPRSGDQAVAPGGATVRVSVRKLEAQMLQSEALLSAKLTAGQRAAELRDLVSRFEDWRKGWAAIQPLARELRQENVASSGTQRLLDFLDWSGDLLKAIESRADVMGRSLENDRREVGKLTDDLLEDSKRLLLLPFGTISSGFAKLARDLSRDQEKEAELTIRGDELEIDKRILEEIKDPIIHLLRNSIDHGIESPAERERLGKPARAKISLVLSQISANKFQLTLSDDGRGIDADRVRESAVRAGIVTSEQAARLDDAAALRLIFESQVTTSPIITQLSGRGLGLAIVREKAEALGGEASVESRKGEGTTFRIALPAMRASFRGILVEAGGELLVLPTIQAERVGRVHADEIRTVQGRETIAFEGRAVPLVSLAAVLELPSATRNDQALAGITVLVAGSGEQRVALAVDAVLDEQEVLVKPLRPPLERVRNVSGATVLGSGRVAPILNVADLLKSARRSAVLRSFDGDRHEMPQAARSVLVAEDSITSRMLLKSILESAGYVVTTAIDGMEAFTLLRQSHFDLVVSDVEMPRLNGFDLTSRIRADRKLADLPVILVTALATQEDRERGIDAGANAYIVKGSFDQSNLLEAVRRLI